MIKQKGKDLFRVQVGKIVYFIQINCRRLENIDYYFYTCTNRAYIYSFYRKLDIEWSIGTIARNYSYHCNNSFGRSIAFDSKEIAISFLYYIDKRYNPTPQPIENFSNLKLFIPR